MTMIAGFTAKLRINGATYTFARADVSTEVDNLRTTNSEGTGGGAASNVGTHTSISGNGCIRINVTNASFDPAENPFLAPRSIAAGAFVVLLMYLNGVGGYSYNVPSFHVISTSQPIDVTGLMPISFSGEGNGNWTNPTV